MIMNYDAVYWIINYDGEIFNFFFEKSNFSRNKLLQYTKLAKVI